MTDALHNIAAGVSGKTPCKCDLDLWENKSPTGHNPTCAVHVESFKIWRQQRLGYTRKAEEES